MPEVAVETMLMYGSGSQDWQNDQKMFITAPSAEITSQASSQYYPFIPSGGAVLGTGKQISNETNETPSANIVHGHYSHASYQNDIYSRPQEQNYMIQNPSHMMAAPIPGSYSSTPSSQDDGMHYGAISHRRPQQNMYTSQSSNVSSPQMMTPSINSYSHLAGVNGGPALHQQYHATPEPSQQQQQQHQQHQQHQQQQHQQPPHQLGPSPQAYPSAQSQNFNDYYQGSYMYGENSTSHFSTFNQPEHIPQLNTASQSNLSHIPIDGSGFKTDVYSAPSLARSGDINERLLGVKADKEFVASSAKPHINYHAGKNGNQDIRQASSTQEPLDFNGRRLRKWKNRRYQCSHCDLSFYDEDLDEYARHVEEVERIQGTAATRRKYKCAEPSCPWHKIGFFRKLEARKHYSRKHGIPEFECRFWAGENKEKFPGCGVCTSRWHADSGNRIRHEQAIHKVPKVEKKRSTSPNAE